MSTINSFIIKTEDLKPGMEVGEDIYIDHVLIVRQHVKMTNKDINKLKIFGVQKIKVIFNEIDKKNYNKKFLKDTINKTKEIFNDAIYNEKIDLNQLEIVIQNILNEVTAQDGFFSVINELKSEDEYTYLHSIETSIYSVITGKRLNLSDENLRKLGVGSLLHDIGKIRTPKDVLLKKGKLNEEEFKQIKRHPIDGKEILIQSGIVDDDILDIVSQHHEKIDGSGYPLGIKGDSMNMLSKIVAVSDIYDALTTDRVYRAKLKKYEVIEYLYCLVNTELDIDVVRSFSKVIKIYPIGSKVALNTGETGEIIELNEDFPLRPIVKVLNEESGQERVIDMINERTIFIEKIIE